ncbi:MAG: T9SS type A sorting domain-containing protein [Janthinobacterium lividum]
MLRYSLLLPFALLATPTLAQTAPSLTAADMPVVGDSLRLSQASPALPTGVPPLSRAGANQTWNYAGLVATGQRVVRYNNVSTAAGALLQFTFNNAFFGPDTRATLVSPQGLPAAAGALPVTDPLEFSAVSSADYRLVGYGGTLSGTAVPVTYASRTQQDVIYRFPLNYGGAADVSNSLLTTPAALASSGYFSQRRQRTNQPDAWGTLTTPFGTFQALRVVTTLADHDSLALGGAPGQGLTLPLVREYKWLAKGVHVPVLTITTTAVAGNEVVTSVEYRDVFRRFVGLATHSAAAEAGLSAYPNPSAVGTGLRLAVPAGGGPLTISGADLLGRQLFTKAYAASPGGTIMLDATTFGPFRGVLLLTVTGAQGTATRRLVRE